jgi:SAM-dependent methyltransferase
VIGAGITRYSHEPPLTVDQPTQTTISPAEANRLFYRDIAEQYDSDCSVFQEVPQERLESLLRRAVGLVATPDRVLDAGGGSGNASLVLLDLGLDPMVADVSPEMVSIWERRARERGHQPRSEVATLEEFFVADERSWDLIVFSSVLHHLEDPIEVLLAAGRRTAEGGVIATIFDPMALGGTGRLIRRIDYLIWLVRHSPGRLGSAVLRRLRRLGGRPDEQPDIGTLAERHAMHGLDDSAIAQAMAATGMEIVSHERLFDARYALLRRVLAAIGSPTAFSFIFRRSRKSGTNRAD